MSDTVNSTLLGMNKVVSDDSARRALKKIGEHDGIDWLQHHLPLSYAPLLNTPWIGERQKRMTITSSHAQASQVQAIYRRLAGFFNDLKAAGN